MSSPNSSTSPVFNRRIKVSRAARTADVIWEAVSARVPCRFNEAHPKWHPATEKLLAAPAWAKPMTLHVMFRNSSG